MENLFLAATLSIMGIGLICSILGLIEFTRSFGPSPEDLPHNAAAAKVPASTGHAA